jgi:hypothetical protein
MQFADINPFLTAKEEENAKKNKIIFNSKKPLRPCAFALRLILFTPPKKPLRPLRTPAPRSLGGCGEY